jgi:hypothetical protein
MRIWVTYITDISIQKCEVTIYNYHFPGESKLILKIIRFYTCVGSEVQSKQLSKINIFIYNIPVIQLLESMAFSHGTVGTLRVLHYPDFFIGTIADCKVLS